MPLSPAKALLSPYPSLLLFTLKYAIPKPNFAHPHQPPPLLVSPGPLLMGHRSPVLLKPHPSPCGVYLSRGSRPRRPIRVSLGRPRRTLLLPPGGAGAPRKPGQRRDKNAQHGALRFCRETGFLSCRGLCQPRDPADSNAVVRLKIPTLKMFKNVRVQRNQPRKTAPRRCLSGWSLVLPAAVRR